MEKDKQKNFLKKGKTFFQKKGQFEFKDMDRGINNLFNSLNHFPLLKK